MKITNNAFNGLNKIATATKMDCWFWLEEDFRGNVTIVDLENDEELDTTTGLSQLAEGIVDTLSSMKLTQDEIDAVEFLFDCYDIKIDPKLLC